MRYLRVVLALVFGLAVAGPETHACPVHSATHAPAHHPDTPGHPETPHRTCPQPRCPTHPGQRPPPAPAHPQAPRGHQEPAHCPCPQPCCPTPLGASLPASAAWIV